MMQLNRVLWLFVAVILIAGTNSFADDKIPNPQYDAWAKFKPGTVVKYSQSTEAMGTKNDGEMTQTLASLTREKAVVEVKMMMVMQGNKMDMPAQKLEFPARVAPNEIQNPGQPQGVKVKVDDMQSGTETIEVAGKSYDCKWYSFTADQDGMKIVAKSWMSPAVPGGMVKMESSTTGTVNSTTNLTLMGMRSK